MEKLIKQPARPERTWSKPWGNAVLLDWLRFIAAALVVANHLRVNSFLPFSQVEATVLVLKFGFFQMTRIGVEAVLLFFVLSGYLVGGMAVQRAAAGKFDPVRYAIDRVTRIYVPFLPLLLLTVALLLGLGFAVSWYEVIVNAASLQGVIGPPFSGNTALWSLSYEVWFYVACGGLLAAYRGSTVCTKAIGLAATFASIVVFSQLQIAYCISWMIGVVAFFLPVGRRAPLLTAGILISAVGVVLMQATSVSNQIDLSAFRWADRSVAIVVLACGLGLVVAVCGNPSVIETSRVRFAAVGRFLSSFSYTLYLAHNPIMVSMQKCGILHKFDRLDMSSFAHFMFNFVLICAISYVLYLIFERHTGAVRAYAYRALKRVATTRGRVSHDATP